MRAMALRAGSKRLRFVAPFCRARYVFRELLPVAPLLGPGVEGHEGRCVAGELVEAARRVRLRHPLPHPGLKRARRLSGPSANPWCGRRGGSKANPEPHDNRYDRGELAHIRSHDARSLYRSRVLTGRNPLKSLRNLASKKYRQKILPKETMEGIHRLPIRTPRTARPAKARLQRIKSRDSGKKVSQSL